jgi:hypothetical protein
MKNRHKAKVLAVEEFITCPFGRADGGVTTGILFEEGTDLKVGDILVSSPPKTANKEEQ